MKRFIDIIFDSNVLQEEIEASGQIQLIHGKDFLGFFQKSGIGFEIDLGIFFYSYQSSPPPSFLYCNTNRQNWQCQQKKQKRPKTFPLLILPHRLFHLRQTNPK